jgi:hypothetical protein
MDAIARRPLPTQTESRFCTSRFIPATLVRTAAKEESTCRKNPQRWYVSWDKRHLRQLCLRGSACDATPGQIFTAEEPANAGAEKYDATAIAMIALLKYGTGVPFKRLERLEGQLGMPLPAATQWELMEAAAGLLRPVLEGLMRQGAQGTVLHNDDTNMCVLRLVRDAGDKRSGVFTSGVVSTAGGWKIALFFTGRKHAGENIAEVLQRRARQLPPPIQMCFHGRFAHRRT